MLVRGPYSGAMSTERMIADLEAHMDRIEGEEIRAAADELGRAERARVLLADRLRGARGRPVRLHLLDGSTVAGTADEVGATWVLLRSPDGARIWVALAAIALAEGLGPRARSHTGSLPPRSLGSVLREIARDRTLVHLTTGDLELTARIASVGSDHVDVVMLPTGEAGAVAAGGRAVIPFPALRVVRAFS